MTCSLVCAHICLLMELRSPPRVIPKKVDNSESPEMTQGITIIHDGECPFCTRYVSLLRLRGAVGAVVLVDAHSDAVQVHDAVAHGLDLDEGMVVIWEGKMFYGAAAVHLLATLSGSGGLLNRMQRVLFASPARAAVIYPVLARGRRLFLRLVVRQTIAQDQKSGPHRKY